MILIGDCREKMEELIADKAKVQTCVTIFLLTLLRQGVTTMETEKEIIA